VGFVVAADGGAVRAERLGLRLDLVVGDADSLAEADLVRIEATGVKITAVAAAKNESDTELAVLAAVERGFGKVTVLGAFGGNRLDHALANVGLLALPALGGQAELLDERTRVTLLEAPGADGGPVRRELPGPVGDTVSLLPVLGDALGVTTEGLEYPLRDEPLPAGPARGLSNVRAESAASVTLRRGRLLIVETRTILRP
jgi:thiamine pyrophosphokinase